jgi:anhydro-N-acetylmuramic acid kinase
MSSNSSQHSALYIGLMSGTSLDGIDAVLASFNDGKPRYIESAALDFPAALKAELMALQAPLENEIHREALAANSLARCYADCVAALLAKARITSDAVEAVAVHGQTIRHRPECGYTWQTNNPALLAELCGIDVIADFRTRDIAAGGQGAPLVPAFHAAVFGAPDASRVVANIGGIANISILPAGRAGSVTGFDTGPGNVLMDAWIAENLGKPYDEDGRWAAGGSVDARLLTHLCEEPYLALPPPKSTGRDLFHPAWLAARLAAFPAVPPQDVQATLTAFTATTLAEAIVRCAPTATALYLCGGGAKNGQLIALLRASLQEKGHQISIETTAALGIEPQHVEALAFAWLGYRFMARLPGNLPAVTGAAGARILGALYPA